MVAEKRGRELNQLLIRLYARMRHILIGPLSYRGQQEWHSVGRWACRIGFCTLP